LSATGNIALQQIKYLLFDLDGTLIDSTELILKTFRDTFDTLGMPKRSDEQLLSQVGRPLYLQMRDIDPERQSELVEMYAKLYRENHDQLIREIPGVKGALTELKDRGYRMAVVTSKRSSGTQYDLKHFAMTHLIEVVVAANDTDHHKPRPEPVLKALERLGASSREATYIGDSPFDIRSAHAAGVLAGAVEWSPFPREVLEAEEPDFWVPTPESLTELFPGPNPR
jgi:pyrophosphatase PpaX